MTSAALPRRAPADRPELARLLRAFACAAVEPGLAGVLLFDVPDDALDTVTALFAAVFGRDTAAVVLGAAAREDELWTRIGLEPGDGGLTVRARRGALVEDDPGAAPATAVVPDLARLGLPGLRAAVTLVGADVASVQRHGVGVVWRPRARWLAFCRSADAGRISPHLLDRFPLRLSLPGLVLPAEPGTPGELWRGSAERAALDQARTAAAPVRVGAAALERVAQAAPAAGGGERRALALGRIARALARLDGAGTAEPGHVDAAARLIGLPAEAPPQAAAPEEAGLPPVPPPPAAAGRGTGGTPDTAGGGTTTRLAHTGGPAESLEPQPAAAGPDRPAGPPYPEDDAEPLHDHAPLRGAWRRTVHSERGPVVGVRRASDLRDLALVPTVVAAASKRRLRGELTVTAEDLRSHIRAAEPDRMLVLLLDHTCRRGRDWQAVLAPYLRWAYTGRAAAAVVEVGGAGAPDELRAEAFLARNVLEPRLSAALHRRPGRSSPLAHGLLLAGQFVRRAFQQQPTALAEAWFVAVTDGRGNVPLGASLTGRLTPPVGRRGIDDALSAAAQLGALNRMRLHTVVVDAGAEPYPDLPFTLADALGALTVAGPDGEPADDD
ncbi:magnesium chelatase [Streptomyces sp. NPDC021224]|uniref:magnesium chelatase n=1 Tax=unclassified Streptomyces TaxID=2593676 RepID=UPI0037AA8D49